MKIEIGCPVTIGDFNRLVKNLKVYKKLNDEQKDWLNEFIDKYDYEFKKVVLKIEDGVLWVIINTKNNVRQFEE